MALTTLFSTAWRRIRQQRWLWGLGLLLALGTLFATAVHLWLLEIVVQAVLSGNLLPIAPLMLSSDIGQWLLPAGAGGFVVITAVWLLATAAEAGIIIGVTAQERPWSTRQALKAGWRWLGRFIAIDALVFLPWFGLTLLLMLIVFVSLGSAALLTLRESPFAEIVGALGLGLICLVPLLLLLPPLTWISLLLRRLAFRQAVLADAAARASLAQTWQQLRGRWLDVAILAVLLWGMDYGLGLVLLAVDVVGLATTAVIGGAIFDTAVRLGVLLLVALPLALFYAWTAVVWTLAWQDIMSNGQ